MDDMIGYIFKDSRLDKVDIKILSAIKHDARMPLKDIASRCRISKQTALYRINKLMQDGIIRGFHSDIDYARLGYNIYYVYLQTRYIEDEDKFRKSLSEVTGCLVIMKSVTQYGYNLKVLTRDIYSLVRDMEKFFTQNKNVISHFMLQRLDVAVDKGQVYRIDYIDRMILSELSIDCRINDLELSRKLRLGYDLVHSRVKKLVKDRILRKFNTMIIFEDHGFMYYNVLLKFSDDNLEKFALFDSILETDTLVLEKFRCVGEFSYVFEIIDKDYKSINEKLNRIRSQFHDMIRNSQIVPIESHYFYKARFE